MAPRKAVEAKLAVISAVFAFFVLAPLAAQFRALWDTDSYLHRDRVTTGPKESSSPRPGAASA